MARLAMRPSETDALILARNQIARLRQENARLRNQVRTLSDMNSRLAIELRNIQKTINTILRAPQAQSVTAQHAGDSSNG
jgi:regulator of replication initiation timing